MQISGVIKVKERVLAEDTTTHDLYDSVEIEVSDLRMSMPRPLFLKDGDKEMGFVLQYTSSGTIDLKLVPVTKVASTPEEMNLAAENVVRSERAKASETPSPDAVDRKSPEFKKALAQVKKDVKKNEGKGSLARAASPIKGILKSGKNGNRELVPVKN